MKLGRAVLNEGGALTQRDRNRRSGRRTPDDGGGCWRDVTLVRDPWGYQSWKKQGGTVA